MWFFVILAIVAVLWFIKNALGIDHIEIQRVPRVEDEREQHAIEDGFCRKLIEVLPSVSNEEIVQEYYVEEYPIKGINVYTSPSNYPEGAHDGYVVASDKNKYDAYALAVYDESFAHIGYLPKGNGELHSLIKRSGGAIRCRFNYEKKRGYNDGRTFAVSYLHLVKDLYSPLRIERLSQTLKSRLAYADNIGPDRPVCLPAVLTLSKTGASVRIEVDDDPSSTATLRLEALKSRLSDSSIIRCSALFYCSNPHAQTPSYHGYILIPRQDPTTSI